MPQYYANSLPGAQNRKGFQWLEARRTLAIYAGNGISTVVVSSWEKKLDRTVLKEELGA